MDVKYITVKAKKLNTIPIVDGQIIAVSDKDAWFYDMEGERRIVSGQKIVESLPVDTSNIYPNTLFIVTQGANKGILCWTGTEFKPVAEGNTDENVKSTPTELDMFYVVGDSSPSENTATLKKHAEVYVDGNTGKIHANGFTGGKADEALNAESAELADRSINDSEGQNISATYIKSVTIQGTSVTITYGDGTREVMSTQDTDTHSVTNVIVGNSDTSKVNQVASNGDVHLNVLDDATMRSSHSIVGTGVVSVTSDASGNIIVEGVDKWKPNTSQEGGYVTAGIPNKVWSTDEAGNPAWRNQQSTYVHPDSGVHSGSYTKVQVNEQGHVISGTNPTTLSGYGITDAIPYLVLSDNDNLNSIKQPGFYIGLSGNGIRNKPDDVDSFGLLVVKVDSSDDYILQRIFASGNSAHSDKVNTNQHTRRCIANVFEAWHIDELTDTVYQHPTTSGYIHIPLGGQPGQILAWESDGTAQWQDPSAVAVAVMVGSTPTTQGKSGIVPAPDAGPADAFLRNDGVWATPPDTTYGDLIGTDGSESGEAGLVPAPQPSEADMYLNSDGTWHKIDTSEYKAVWEKFPRQ